MAVKNKGIRSTIKKLTELPQKVEEAYNTAVSDIILTEIARTGKLGQDPDQNWWVPRKKTYPHPIMNKSGGLFNSYNVNTKKGISIKNTAPYAQYHHLGTGNLPVRKLFPSTLSKYLLGLIIKDLNKSINKFLTK